MSSGQFQSATKYVRLIWPDGTSCICLNSFEAEQMIDDSDTAGPFKFEDVWLTPAEFEALPDFQG